MKDHRVAITGVSGDVGFGAIKGIREGHPSVSILGLDCSSDCAGHHLCNRFEMMPRVDSDSYISTLKSALSKYKIELLIPGIDSELELLCQYREEIERDTPTSILLCDDTSLLKCVDKYKTATWLYNLGLPALHTIPASVIPNNEPAKFILSEFQSTFPIVIKPRQGHGSEGIRYVKNINELSRQLETLSPDDCLQEYVEGDEITCGLLFDKQGNLADSLSMIRTLNNGRTVSATVYENAPLNDFINSFSQKTKLVGPINLQLRINEDGQPLVFEINPRLSGSTLMRIAVGFNDPARIVTHFLDDLPIRRAQVNKAKVYRTESTLTVVNSKTSPPMKENILRSRNEIKHIVFDCGGTLLHLVPDRTLVCRDVLHQLGYEFSTGQIHLAYELVNFALRQRSSIIQTAEEKQIFYNEFNGRLAIALGISSHQDKFNSLLQAAFAERCHWSPLPGVISTLESLAAQEGYTLHVLANWNSRLPNLLMKTGIGDYFASIYHSAGLGVEKPEIDIFLAFAEHAGISPQQALYIGNEYEADIHGSRAAGFTPILLDINNWYTNTIDCMLVKDWHQLRELLDNLFLKDAKRK